MLPFSITFFSSSIWKSLYWSNISKTICLVFRKHNIYRRQSLFFFWLLQFIIGIRIKIKFVQICIFLRPIKITRMNVYFLDAPTYCLLWFLLTLSYLIHTNNMLGKYCKCTHLLNYKGVNRGTKTYFWLSYFCFST